MGMEPSQTILDCRPETLTSRLLVNFKGALMRRRSYSRRRRGRSLVGRRRRSPARRIGYRM